MQEVVSNNVIFFFMLLLKGSLKIKLILLCALFKLGVKLITLSII